MKSLVWLTELALIDLGAQCGANTSKDVVTVHTRTKHEGESFITISLPDLGAAFDRALATGQLTPSMTPSFSWHRSGLPKFLRGFLSQVFGNDGKLLLKPSVDAIAAIRQICYLQKKVLRECDKSRTSKALRNYKECDDELDETNFTTSTEDLTVFRSVAAIVWTDLLRSIPFGDAYSEFVPSHGPGATVERVQGNAKHKFQRWHQRLEDEFPFTEFGLSTVRNLGEETCPLSRVQFVEPSAESPVRVTLVPKTMKTPRVIAVEPVCMQYIQQAILKWLVPLIENGKYTGGRVGFTDQSTNGALALSSSRDRRFATIDLSEASDRVSLTHVNDMLASVPKFRDQVMACRSTRAELPDGEVINLKKFASMGSALCFPMEAMVFFLIIVSRRLQERKLAVSPKNIQKMSRDVFIYGDDIIVPTDEAPSISVHLELFGLKVNQRKSFWTGGFRESCGVDAYDGNNVTPTYARHEFPSGRQDVNAIISWVSMANQLYMAGHWTMVREIRNRLERVCGKLPHLGDKAQGLAWQSFRGESTHSRWNKDLMRFETRTLVPTPTRKADDINDDYALMKCLTLGANPGKDINGSHGQRQDRRFSLAWWLSTIGFTTRSSKDHLSRSDRKSVV